MSREVRSATWQRALIALSSTVIGVIVVTGLYWGRAVFIPMAMAIFLTFVLSPLVNFLQRRGLSHVLAIVAVVSLTILLLTSISWVVTYEASALLEELPEHTEQIKAKIQAIRETVQEYGGSRLGKMVDEISTFLKGEPDDNSPAPPDSAPGDNQPPKPVIVQPGGPPWLSWLSSGLAQLLELFSKFALAVVLFIFMLAKRADMRNRFIRLAGVDQMTLTTKALDDAGQRVSRYLLTQLGINASFGLLLAAGLFALGVRHAFLWGFLAAVLRFAPFVGAPIAALFPITVSVVLSDGWSQPIFVALLFIALELITVNLLEPVLYGHSMGISEVAQVTSAAFWAFLWGPIGLVLSGPITACLLVLGKNVPRLQFLEILLGHEPALSPAASYYQRLTARDQDEALEILQARLKEVQPEEVYDDLLIPALNQAGHDLAHGDLSEAEVRFICETTSEFLDDVANSLAETAKDDANGLVEDDVDKTLPVCLLACPARDAREQVALEMFQQLLKPRKWQVHLMSAATLAGELIAKVEEIEPAVVCIASLPPGGVAHTRYLCMRLRNRFPKLRLLVGRWGQQSRLDEVREQLQAAGVDSVQTTLLSAKRQLQAWFPVLTSGSTPAAGADKKLAATTAG